MSKLTTAELLEEIPSALNNAKELARIKQAILSSIASPKGYDEALVDAIITKAQEIDGEDLDMVSQSSRMRGLSRKYYNMKKQLLTRVGEGQPASSSTREERLRECVEKYRGCLSYAAAVRQAKNQ